MNIVELLNDINSLYLEDLQKENHPSIFIKEKNYRILIIRGLEINKDGLDYISRGIVINKEKEVFFYDRKEENLVKSDSGFENLIDIISPIYSRNKRIMKSYANEIDHLEDSLYERKAPRIFMDIWFDVKKDLAHIERHLTRNIGVLEEFYKSNSKEPGFQTSEFKDLIEEIKYSLHHASTQVSRLDALYSYYNSIKNEKLNKNIYMLTLLSAVFLPLNLIVGFFGMNTENLFFKENPLGTQYVLWIIIGSFGASAFGLPLIRLVDNILLKTFLGRYDMYQKFSAKIDKILKNE